MERADVFSSLRTQGRFTQKDFDQACRARRLKQLSVSGSQAVVLGAAGALELGLCRRAMQRLSKESVAKQLLERRVGKVLSQEGWVFTARLNPYLTEYRRDGDLKLYLALKADNYKARGVRDLVSRFRQELFSGRAILMVATSEPQTLQAFSRYGAAFKVFDLRPVRGKPC